MEHIIHFAGSNLDRSFGNRKDELFVRDCVASSESLFLLVHSGKIVCKLIDQQASGNLCAYQLMFFPQKAAKCALLLDSFEPLLQQNMRDAVVILGCTYDEDEAPIWHIAVDAFLSKVTNEDSFISECNSSVRKLAGYQDINLKLGDIRNLIHDSSKFDIAIAGHALAIINWHRSNIYSSFSGQFTKCIEAGSKRECVTTKRKIYPRCDPVAIACVISADGQRCLIGRSKKYPPGLHSCLSGFIEVRITSLSFTRLSLRSIFRHVKRSKMQSDAKCEKNQA